MNKVVVHEVGLDEEFDSVVGIQKSFGFRALSSDVVLQRWFDCWCGVCISVSKLA